ncbi:Protein of unknown function [Cotesia congregata]|uniref:Uncharacterized protein n=1 Tax=Cotesia congregata TaxID=51543 RepID=A0A8J2H7B6_COTCN|nr:Protein of unknown function [Cotesia congregata]
MYSLGGLLKLTIISMSVILYLPVPSRLRLRVFLPDGKTGTGVYREIAQYSSPWSFRPVAASSEQQPATTRFTISPVIVNCVFLSRCDNFFI